MQKQLDSLRKKEFTGRLTLPSFTQGAQSLRAVAWHLLMHGGGKAITLGKAGQS